MQFLFTACHAAITHYPSVLLTLFLAGLVGGGTHCTGMCGPFVVAQARSYSKAERGFGRLSKQLLIPYHLGRMTTYTFLGVLAVFVMGRLTDNPWGKWVSIVALFVAGMMFVLSLWPGMFKGVPKEFRFISKGIAPIIGKMAGKLMVDISWIKSYGLGVLLGFLPCGLVMASLLVVASTHHVGTALAGMILFGLGTVPALCGISLAGNWLSGAFPNAMMYISKMAMMFNGVSLIVLAGKMAL